MHDHFTPFGEITSAKISITANFESRGYGFVEFTTIESAVKAVGEMNGKIIEQVGGAPPSGGRSSNSDDATTRITLEVSHYESKRHRTKPG